MGPTEAIKACFFVKGVWKRQWISPSSEGVHLTRSKDVTGSHLKVNGYAVSGHHAQFPQPHLSSHVGKGSDADVQLPKRANRNDSLSMFPIFTRYISGTGIHWCDAVLLPGARFGIWSKGWSWSCSIFLVANIGQSRTQVMCFIVLSFLLLWNSHSDVSQGGNEVYKSLQHCYEQGGHWNSHRKVPAWHEDARGEHSVYAFQIFLVFLLH